MKKKKIAWILSAVILWSAVPFPALASDVVRKGVERTETDENADSNGGRGITENDEDEEIGGDTDRAAGADEAAEAGEDEDTNKALGTDKAAGAGEDEDTNNPAGTDETAKADQGEDINNAAGTDKDAETGQDAEENEAAGLDVNGETGNEENVCVTVVPESTEEMAETGAMAEQDVQSYELSLSTSQILFDDQTEGYAETQTEYVTVTNTGTEPWDFSETQYAKSVIDVEGIPAEPLPSGESAVLTITTKTGLEPSHDEAESSDNNFGGSIWFNNDKFYGRVPYHITYYFTVFPYYEISTGVLLAIPEILPITGIPNGTGKKAELLGLPFWIEIDTSLGNRSARIQWDTENCNYDPDNREEQSFSVNGTLILPDDITNPSGISTEVTAQVTVKEFDVNNQTEYLLEASCSEVDFNKYYENCADDVEGPMVTFYNKGTKPLDITIIMPPYFGCGIQSDDQDPHNLLPGESYLVELREDRNFLTEGLYSENMRVITQIPGVELNIPLRYRADSTGDEKISANRQRLDFGEVEEGGDWAQAQTVVIENTGNKKVTVSARDSSNIFQIEAPSKAELKPGEKHTYIIQPKKKLRPGRYQSYIEVSTGTVTKKIFATVKVLSQSAVLEKIEGISPVLAENGCPKLSGALGLPNLAVLHTDSGETKGMILWDVEDCAYNPDIREEQKFQVKGTIMLPFSVKNPDNLELSVTADVTVKAAEGEKNKDFNLSLAKDVVYMAGPGTSSERIQLTNTGEKSLRIEDDWYYPFMYVSVDKRVLKPNESTFVSISLMKGTADFQETEIPFHNYDGSLLNTIKLVWRNENVNNNIPYHFTPTYVDFGKIEGNNDAAYLQTVTFRNNGAGDIVINGAKSKYFEVLMDEKFMIVPAGESIEMDIVLKADEKGRYPKAGTYYDTIQFQTDNESVDVVLDAGFEMTYSDEPAKPTAAPGKTPTKIPTKAPSGIPSVSPTGTLSPTVSVKPSTAAPAFAQSQEQHKEPVKTGDETPIGRISALLGISVIAILYSVRRRKAK
ncbi:MAG: hypothetical protein Q4C91_01855 [Eubacteriales bacterium]|nr:hypothetical protein [Eubacteriales bacterium]